MSLTTALFTALTGLDVHSRSLDVIGNNITNVNTNGFKSSRSVFETQLSTNLSTGSAPSTESGGTNPNQIGLGVTLVGTKKDFTNGSIQPTGVSSDLALEGPGFFILKQTGQDYYTRAGGFGLDGNHNLAGISGGIVQGFGVDSTFNIVPGVLQDIQIPIGTLTIAEATRNVEMSGNLNASGILATQGSVTTSQALIDSSGPLTTASLLTNIHDAVTPLVTMFNTGDIITIQGAEKGGKSIGTFTFEVGAPGSTTSASAIGNTLGDYMTFLEQIIGINKDVTIGDGAGVTLNGSNQIVIAGNLGTVNDINLQTADMVKNTSPSQPIILTKSQDANGESVRTSFVVFDSLGTPLTVDMSMVLVTKASGGTTWRFFAESLNDTDLDRVLESSPGAGGTGTLDFDTFGALTAVSNPTVSIDRFSTGAVDPLTITVDFKSGSHAVTSLTDARSTLASVFQDGSTIGTLASWSVEQDGTIRGSFTNGLSRSLGQIALATFANPEGLIASGGNSYIAGPNSGDPVFVSALTFGTGRIISGALELSNVDLSQEFVNLISSTTGFTASSRIITTADQLIQQLLSMTR